MSPDAVKGNIGTADGIAALPRITDNANVPKANNSATTARIATGKYSCNCSMALKLETTPGHGKPDSQIRDVTVEWDFANEN